ncbi:MAG: precorrin-2 C(20)-methyltransferase [Firmicutes bacterium HGW-Firmicutes-14]|nr:MAG: precorrin-2 C(20)-methyltransferase [Firmicutes bacterium HGW-Firmicutes-14]
MKGKIFGIGVGPGDPQLMTIKACRILEKVDIVCVPKSKHEKDSLALSIAGRAVDREFETLELLFPMTHDKEVLKRHWDEAAERMAQQAREGKSLAFITIGDPMFYSTYAYILERIKRNYTDIEIETVPGITAFSACSSFINEPLTEADENLAVIPAAYGIPAIREALETNDNVVLMKVNRLYDEVAVLLKEMNLLNNAVYISRCGYEDQFYSTDIEGMTGREKDYMSIMIIRKAGWKSL